MVECDIDQRAIGGPDGLDAAIYDWRNPVVELTIECIQ
jgi:hypothetical protein